MTKSRKTRGTGKSRNARVKASATSKSRSAAKRKAKADAGPPAPTSATCEQPARDDAAAFAESLIASGQAARLDQQGRLPAGATHKIVEDEAGNVKVVRRRISMS